LFRLLAFNLKDEVQSKEDAKIMRKKDLFEQRRIRILNAKQRIIGLDLDALDAQVEEKKRQKERERELEESDRNRNMECERILLTAADEEKKFRATKMQELKKEWDDAARLRRMKPIIPDYEPDIAGPSSLQYFSGEDREKIERMKIQKKQMYDWIQEQISEKSYLKHLEKEEEMSYAEMIKAIDEIRESAEKEENDMRKYNLLQMKNENKSLAITQNERNSTLFNTLRSAEASDTSLDLFQTNQIEGELNEYGRVARKDMFKGFTDEQKRKIFQDNQQLIRNKNLMKENEDNLEKDWSFQQTLGIRAMEQSEYEDKVFKEIMKNEHFSILQQQETEQKKKQR